MARRRNNRRFGPKCGDKAIDWIFRRIIARLKGGKIKVYKVNDLRDPDDRRRGLAGRYLPKDKDEGILTNMVFLNYPGKVNPITEKNLLHELLHDLFDGWVGEPAILSMEEVVWNKLTPEQKKLLKSFIPKHYVKLKPKDLEK